MSFKDFLNKINEKKKIEKEEFRAMAREERLKHKLEERKKPAYQREHEFYEKEKEREAMKKLVKIERKEREERMKNLSDPFNKPHLFKESGDLFKSNVRWM